MEIVTAEEQVNLFSEYPKEADEFFEQKKLVIKVIPTELMELEEELAEFRVTTTKEFYDYLNSEIEFWKLGDATDKLKSFSKIDRLMVTCKTSQRIYYYRGKNKSLSGIF